MARQNIHAAAGSEAQLTPKGQFSRHGPQSPSAGSVEAAIISALVAALAEMGDKTQLLAVLLSARFKKPVPIIAGIFTAILCNHVLAAFGGYLLSDFLAGAWFHYLIAASFLIMAVWTLVPDKIDPDEKPRSHGGVFLTTLIAFFFVEMGDKTQIATAALAARFHNVPLIALGTTIGVVAADIPAVFLANAAIGRIPIDAMRMAAAGVFFLLGLWALADAVHLF